MSCPHNYDSRFIRDNIEDLTFNKFCKNCENLYHENEKAKCKFENLMRKDDFKFPVDTGYQLGNGYYRGGYIEGGKSNNNPDKFQEPDTNAEELNMLKHYSFLLGGMDVTDTQK